MLSLITRVVIDKDFIEAPNLCDRFETTELQAIGNLCFQGFTKDKQSRWKWERRMEAAMDLAMQVQRPKTFPWPGSSNVVFPLITIAALQFCGRAYPALINGPDIFRYRTVGPDPTGDIRKRADRIGKHMSWQVMEQDASWEEQHDRMLIVLAVMGCDFIKSYFDGGLGHNVSELVLPQDLVCDYYAKSIETAARKTQLMPMSKNDVYSMVRRDVFKDVLDTDWFNSTPTTEATTSTSKSDNRRGEDPPPGDQDTPFPFLEQHRWLDLDQDGYAEPYIVTFERHSKEIVRLTARFNEQSIERNIRREIVSIKAEEYYTKYSFIPSPDAGIYDLGFGTFLGPINESVNTAINQLIDNGTMQNSIGGFLGRGVKIRGGVYTMAPWEWKRIDSYGDDIKKNMVPFPERQPSDVLFKLLGLLIEYASRVAGTTDEQVGKNPGQNTPASTFQGMQEQGSQVFSMIFKRVWRSMKEEAKKLYALNRMYCRTAAQFGAGKDFIRQEDYLGSPDQIAPVANPKVTSTTMTTMQATAVKQSSMSTAGYQKDETEKMWLRSIGIEQDVIDKIFPGSETTGPLPNFKVQIEEAKTQLGMAKLKAEQQKWANHLLEEQRKNNAEIHLMYAQAMQAMAQAKATGDATKLQAFELAMNALQEKDKRINEQLKMAMDAQKGDDSEGNGAKGGGLPGLGQPSGNEAGPGGAAGGGGPDQGAMGGGGVSA